jgi:hypothetical protein
MKKQSIETKIKGLEDELGFCLYKLQGMFPLDHWKIRAIEIEKELKLLKRKVKSNGKRS